MTSERLQVGGDQVAFRVTSEEGDDAFVAIEVRMGPGGGPGEVVAIPSGREHTIRITRRLHAVA